MLKWKKYNSLRNQTQSGNHYAMQGAATACATLLPKALSWYVHYNKYTII